MRIIQILLFVMLSLVVNITCQRFLASKRNKNLPVEIEVDKNGDVRDSDGNGGNILALYS